MATVKISELVQLIGPPDSDDFIPIVDANVSQTKKILISDLLSGDSALNATNAIYAQYADSATDATFAIVANRAFTADSVQVANSALRADAADSAINATNAIVAQRAFTADSAGNATFALTADRALTADSCLRATTALVADRTLVDSTARATQAIYALRADSAFFAYTAVRAARLDYDAGPIWGADSNIASGDSALDILRTDLNAVTVGDSASIISVLSTGVQSILPAADSTYDLGSPTRKWRDLWLSGATIHLGDSAILSATGQTITIPNLVVTGTSTGAGVDSAYVLAQINGLIDGAPGTLNTLNEIAAALNDDDSAYATLVNLIGAKDSDFVKSAADATWIQSQQITYTIPTFGNDYVDSGAVTTLITTTVDSAYVVARAGAVASGISNLVEDSTPQLGGDLELNGNSVVLGTTSEGNVTLETFVNGADVGGSRQAEWKVKIAGPYGNNFGELIEFSGDSAIGNTLTFDVSTNLLTHGAVINYTDDLIIKAPTTTFVTGLIGKNVVEANDSAGVITIDGNISSIAYDFLASGNRVLAFTNIPTTNNRSYEFQLITTANITFTGVTVNGTSTNPAFLGGVSSTTTTSITTVKLLYPGTSNVIAFVGIEAYS